MMDYDKEHWADNKCPKIDCRKKKHCCGLQYVSIPTALTDETAPRNGLYCNAVVKYEDTGEVWIYSSEGVPVLVRSGNDN